MAKVAKRYRKPWDNNVSPGAQWKVHTWFVNPDQGCLCLCTRDVSFNKAAKKVEAGDSKNKLKSFHDELDMGQVSRIYDVSASNECSLMEAYVIVEGEDHLSKNELKALEKSPRLIAHSDYYDKDLDKRVVEAPKKPAVKKTLKKAEA